MVSTMQALRHWGGTQWTFYVLLGAGGEHSVERMCQRQLLPAAWVALDGGADNVLALRGLATSHLGQC